MVTLGTGPIGQVSFLQMMSCQSEVPRSLEIVDRWLKPGPSPARSRFWKSGNLEIQKFGIQAISKMNICKFQIHVVQNVGKV